jgi:hypothetical protein
VACGLTPPSPAPASAGWSVKQFVSKAGVAEIFLSLLLWTLTKYGEASYFLLVGNVLCVAGNVVFVRMLYDWPGPCSLSRTRALAPLARSRHRLRTGH